MANSVLVAVFSQAVVKAYEKLEYIGYSKEELDESLDAFFKIMADGEGE